ncbi:MAG: glycosyltransferase [Nitrososphaerota archaeon]|nr:glycosyltransferase [Nitrososphaerota archaeon]
MRDDLVFRDRVVLSVKGVVSLVPKLGLVKKPRFHVEGVSFVVAVKDEERWIRSCILSIVDVADEIIVVDSSVEDGTTEIVESLAAEYDKIRHIKFYYEGPNAIALAQHIGLVSAKYKWIFKWDSDNVARSSQALQQWMDRLKQLDKDRYYVIDIPRINLEGDLEHQSRRMPFGDYGALLFTWSPELRWIIKESNSGEQILGDSIWGHRFPPWFKHIRWPEPYIFHCNIKSPKRSLTRKYWIDYMTHKGTGFANLDEYAAFRVKQEYGLSLEEAIAKNTALLAEDMIPYDKTRFGELPDILKNIQKTL